jgi:hypothetical protein
MTIDFNICENCNDICYEDCQYHFDSDDILYLPKNKSEINKLKKLYKTHSSWDEEGEKLDVLLENIQRLEAQNNMCVDCVPKDIIEIETLDFCGRVFYLPPNIYRVENKTEIINHDYVEFTKL